MKFSSKTFYVFGCFLCLNLVLVTVRCDDEEEEIGSTEFGSKIEKPNTNNFKVSKKVLGKEKGYSTFYKPWWNNFSYPRLLSYTVGPFALCLYFSGPKSYFAKF